MSRSRYAPFALMVSCLLAGTASLAAAQGPQAAPAQRALNRAADALLALKSTRFVLKREGAPAPLDASGGITFTTADCVYAAPDRTSCNIKVTLKNGPILEVTRVWVPEGTFQSNPLTQQFVRLPADEDFNGSVLFARSGIPEILRTGISKPQIVGKERLQNRDTQHIRGEASGKTLNALAGALNPDLTHTVDLWMDDATGNVVQLHVAEPAGSGWLVELSGTNEPVKIPTPQVPPPAGRP